MVESTSWKEVYLVGVFSLIQNTQYSIYLTTMFSYMLKLNPASTEAQFGWIMATSSLGHCVGCFALGYWTSSTGKTRPPMVFGLVLMLASNLVYLSVDQLPASLVVSTLMLSRLLGGLGMGNSTPMRVAASSHSAPADRPKAMASLSGGRSVGTIVGPGLQLLFVPLGEQGVQLLPGLRIHSNNASAVLGVVLTVAGFVALCFFDEVQPIAKTTTTSDDVDSLESQPQETVYPSPDKLAMGICMLTRFVQNFMQIAIETLAPAMLMLMFEKRRQEAVATMSLTYLVTGFIATLLYLSIIFTSLSKFVRDKSGNLIVLVAFVGHLLVTYPWQFYSTDAHPRDNETGLGCDVDRFSWCDGLTNVPEWNFYIGYIVAFGLFMPILNVANATLFSKLLHPQQQGTEQSLYDISNTVARIFAPILITMTYTSFGPRRAWELMGAELLATVVLWVAFDRRLVPLRPISSLQSSCSTSTIDCSDASTDDAPKS